MAAWSICRGTFCNSQHWQPVTSITELQRFLGSTVANSAGDACGTFLSGIANLNYTSYVVSWRTTFSFLTLKNNQKTILGVEET